VTSTDQQPTAEIGLIWAQARGGVIGRDGTMPWHLPEDLAHFRDLTRGCRVVMGRATWQALPERFRPLPDRHNVVLTRQQGLVLPGAEVTGSLSEALGGLGDAAAGGSTVWVIGGGQVYAATMHYAHRLCVTEIDDEVDGDTYAPAIDGEWLLVSRDSDAGWQLSRTGLRYRFREYRRAHR
jgi:dihydrofolate reductase